MLRRLRATASPNEVVHTRTNEVSIKRRSLDTHTADPPTRAAADHHIRIFAPLMSSNDEVERRGASLTTNEADLSRC